MLFSTFMELCNHPRNQFLNTFYIPLKIPVLFSYHLPHLQGPLPRCHSSTLWTCRSAISYKWNNIICNNLWLAYFYLTCSFKVYPCCSMSQYFPLFYCQVTFHCMAMSCTVYPSIHLWTFGIFWTSIFFGLCIKLLWTSMCKFLCDICFYSSCIYAQWWDCRIKWRFHA